MIKNLSVFEQKLEKAKIYLQ